MPAKNPYNKSEKETYFHIYNKGVENRIIFNDEKDYEVFLGYLKDYLTIPKDPESIKKVFTVHGRTFRGAPHQPKNYLNKIELIAYSLMPSHFHLLLHQKTYGSIESFIRSLCTRYSMYFNKKHQHTGALFEGPYKSVQVEDKTRLLYLTRYLHHAGGYSSYAQYLGTRVTTWVKPEVVQSFFNKVKTGLFKGADSYKDFVEKYEPDQKDNELTESITLESKNQHLERKDLARDVENYSPEIPTESSEKTNLDPNLKSPKRIPEFLAAAAIFLLLLSLGIKNIMISATKPPQPSTPPSVLSETKKIEEIKPKMILTVKIDDNSAQVNIRQKPTTDSEKIGTAKNGDTFEFVSADSGWYEIKLATESGFISAEYITRNDE